MSKILTLNKSKTSETKAEEVKPEIKQTDAQRYALCGKVMTYLFQEGYRTQWDKPLNKTFKRDLRTVIPNEFMSTRKLTRAIRYHTKSTNYLLGLVEGAERYDIRGVPDGVVSAYEASTALVELQQHHSGFMSKRRKHNRTNHKMIVVDKGSRHERK